MKDRTAEKKRMKLILSGIFLGGGLFLAAAARAIPGFGQWYCAHIYLVLVNCIGRVAGWVPFSISEVLLYVLLLLLLGTGARLIFLKIRGRLERGAASRWGRSVLLTGTVLFFLYMLNCGVNYYRNSFAETTGIQADAYTVRELARTCEWLTREVNQYASQVERDEEGLAKIDNQVGDKAAEAMEAAGERYPGLSGYYPNPKGLLNPWLLSVQQLSGIYAPFTIEANYNTAMTDYNLPFTACHELSHLRGFMREEEANFIAFLACRESEEPEFQYSGSLLGWINCMNVLYQADYQTWEEIHDKICPEVKADLAANNEFWAQYDGRVAEVADQVNDNYLKANGQEAGVQSYDRMADLIVVWYLADELE